MPDEPTRGSEQTIPHPRRLGCTSYAAGHSVHFIQALRSANRPEIARQSWLGSVVGLEGEVLTILSPAGKLVRFRNHDPVRLAAVLALLGEETLVNDQFSILRIGSRCFSVRTDAGERLGVCPTDEPPSDATAGQLVDRVRTHGGVIFRPHG